MNREVMILIPGLNRVPGSLQQRGFVDGLKAASERMPLTEVRDDDVPPEAIRLRGERNGQTVEIDIYEAYWNDLVPSITQASARVRLTRGFSLMWYWIFSRVWLGVFRRKYLTFGLFMSVVSFLAWYLGVLVLFIEAIQNDAPAGLDGVGAWLGSFADGIGGWQFWAVASLVVGFLPVALTVDVSDFAKRYLSEEPLPGKNHPARFDIRDRISGRVDAVLQQDDYDSATLVGHSFGSAVAVDYLADARELGMPVRLVTLASLLELFSKRTPWLGTDVERLASRDQLQEWVDVINRSDWFASGSALPKEGRLRTIEIRSTETIVDKAAARVHARYFGDQQVVRQILRTAE